MGGIKSFSSSQAIANGCVVHSFDPYVSEIKLVHPQMHFHPIGLAGKDYVDDKGTFLSAVHITVFAIATIVELRELAFC